MLSLRHSALARMLGVLGYYKVAATPRGYSLAERVWLRQVSTWRPLDSVQGTRSGGSAMHAGSVSDQSFIESCLRLSASWIMTPAFLLHTKFNARTETGQAVTFYCSLPFRWTRELVGL